MNTHPLYLARTTRNLKLKEVADAVGSDTGNISRIENGQQMPNPELALKLLELFGDVSMVDILRHYNPKKRTVKNPDKSATTKPERIAA